MFIYSYVNECSLFSMCATCRFTTHMHYDVVLPWAVSFIFSYSVSCCFYTRVLLLLKLSLHAFRLVQYWLCTVCFLAIYVLVVLWKESSRSTLWRMIKYIADIGFHLIEDCDHAVSKVQDLYVSKLVDHVRADIMFFMGIIYMCSIYILYSFGVLPDSHNWLSALWSLVI